MSNNIKEVTMTKDDIYKTDDNITIVGKLKKIGLKHLNNQDLND